MGESVSFSIFLKDFFTKPFLQVEKNSDKVFDHMEDNLDELNNKAKKTGRDLEFSLGGVFKKLGGLAASLGVTLGITAGILGSARLGIQAEQTEVAFTTMIGSAEAAKQSIVELSDFAAKTPYGKQEVLAAGKQLLAFGFTADELKGKITNIGDVASGLGQPLGDMAYLMGTVKTQGRAMTMDLNQFANRGVPIFEEVAKVLGINKDQVKDFAEDGKISYAVIEKAFANMSAEGGKFFRMMDSQSQTAGGRLSTMFDNLAALGEKLGLAMLPLINSFVDLGSVLLEKLMPIVNAIAPVFEWIGKNLNSILIVVAPLIAVFGTYAAIMKVVTVAQWALNAAMTANPVGLVVAGIALLIGVLTLAWQKSETFRGIILGLWEVLKDFAGGLGDLFTSPFETLKKVFDGIVGFFKKQVQPLFDMIAAIKEGRWSDAAKLGGKLLFNISPAGLVYGAGAEVVSSDAFKRGFAKGKEIEDEEKDAISTLGEKETSIKALAANAKTTAAAGSKVTDGLVGVAGDGKAARHLTVRIEKLVETLSINSTNIKEGASDLRRLIEETLIDAVRDVETSY